jgi:protein-tyrosine phosphatase
VRAVETSPGRTPTLGPSAERQLSLEGCFNFRDLGGYPTADGRRVRWRRLFRADSLSRLTGPDFEQLGAVGLATVVDLRTASEVTERGRVEWPAPGITYHHLPMLDVLPERDEYVEWAAPAFVADRYTDMLATGAPAVADALRVLADPRSHPAVIHCAAGKDRTGIISALVLGLLGVSDEDIVSDYALSRDNMTRMLVRLREERPGAVTEIKASAAAIVAAEPETMHAFLSRFRADHGSFEGFASGLGLSGAVGALRSALLG